MALQIPFPSLRRRFVKISRRAASPPPPDRLAAYRNADGQIVLIGVLSDDLSDTYVRLRTSDGYIAAVPKAEVVFLDEEAVAS